MNTAVPRHLDICQLLLTCFFIGKYLMNILLIGSPSTEMEEMKEKVRELPRPSTFPVFKGNRVT